ncbi:MAG: S-adenosylmethionine tRNA ribosyltransferase [Bacteroidetes bacterium B1(2017)]|nr:MAG: S-adenosylmethionine tRNA ribosyltransferase [Bacteroidetes bacterium B1(2017)]
MSIQNLSIKDFTYLLPENKIAKHPLENRDQSKLLIYTKQEISEDIFANLHQHIPTESMLVYNNTRVIHARMVFQKESGALIEVFCLEPKQLNYHQIFEAKVSCEWTCLIGNIKRWKGEVLRKKLFINERLIELEATLNQRNGAYATVCFRWNEMDVSFGEILNAAGVLPIPPYLNRESTEKDEEVYQTVYAQKDGSVAAPTAGLHFTDFVFEKLKSKSITTEELTLHVGAGTFMPVKADTMAGHEMHRETIYVSLNTLLNIKAQLELGKPLLAVGTTSLRTLESLYWHGIKLKLGLENYSNLDVQQWDPYELEASLTASESIEKIIEHLHKTNQTELVGSTQVLIAPGYNFKLISGLITNFHQPTSTLLLLVSALVGSAWKEIYTYALENEFRFLSFGDSSLLWKP